MAKFPKEFESLLKTEAFIKLLNSDSLLITELCAIMKILVAASIPFNIIFSPGTRRDAPAIELSIFINPTTTIDFTINLDSGGGIFGGHTT
jgi:hypothetical protein